MKALYLFIPEKLRSLNNKPSHAIRLCLYLACTLLVSACNQVEKKDETATQEWLHADEPSSEPPANPLRNAYFGDLHVHTRNSYDAYIFNVRANPDDAYTFAKGGTIKHTMGFDLRLKSAALDFIAVTDHAEYLGVLKAIDTPGSDYSKVPYADKLFAESRNDILDAFSRFANSLITGQTLPELANPSATLSAWQETIDAAQRHNDPGHFTSFIGYEFTSLPGVKNLHRNVIFASDNVPDKPFSALDSQNPEDLWQFLDQQRAKGADVLAIPHNSNASDGAMFERTMWNGQPITREYAMMRARNEPLVEIIQVKGQSETMPLLSPNDEFAGFELMTSYVGKAKPITQFEGGYVRDALKRGLEIQDKVGANPYKMGIVAATDSHNAAGTVEENNYFSKVGFLDGKPLQRGSVLPDRYANWDEYYQDKKQAPLSSTWNTGGLTGIWAETNTRASLFSAMRRKETFGTSGPRIQVRMFAGYGLAEVDLATRQGLTTAYQKGVPMGADLSTKTGVSPDFVVIALQDKDSGPLQRIQVIKGWTDEKGKAQEKIYDIACADNLPVDPQTRRCQDNGASVNLTTCAFSSDKGDSQLQGHWRDPEFDHTDNAFYYARVLENPTCRWSTWDAIRANTPPNPRLAKTIQERAYTSPIWMHNNSEE